MQNIHLYYKRIWKDNIKCNIKWIAKFFLVFIIKKNYKVTSCFVVWHHLKTIFSTHIHNFQFEFTGCEKSTLFMDPVLFANVLQIWLHEICNTIFLTKPMTAGSQERWGSRSPACEKRFLCHWEGSCPQWPAQTRSQSHRTFKGGATAIGMRVLLLC